MEDSELRSDFAGKAVQIENVLNVKFGNNTIEKFKTEDSGTVELRVWKDFDVLFEITENTFNQNSAFEGGAIFADSINMKLSRNQFLFNEAQW